MMTWINSEYCMTAIAQCIACLVFLGTMEKRARGARFVPITVLMLAVQIFAVWITTHSMGFMAQEPLALRLLKACLSIAVMVVHFLLVCKVPLLTACIRGLTAFMAAELAWGLAMFGHYLVVRNYDVLAPLVQWGITVFVYAVVFVILFLVERRISIRLGPPAGTVRELILTFLIVMICYTLSNLHLIFMANQWADLWNRTLGFIPRMTYVLVGMFILYARRIWRGYLQAQHELERIHNVIESQKGEYEHARVNAEVINQRYHDLKNQIAIMKAGIPSEMQQTWLNDLEEQVEKIEPERLTGNPVLDTILWEKKQFCMLHDITLSYVLDGHLFDRIAMEDLCVLFGGALDNAIEAVQKIEDKERRLIHVKAMEQQGYLVLCVENVNDTPLEYEKGMPVTTKDDKSSHGFGIKGIRYVAEKYGGSISIAQEDGWFRLTVLLR